MTLEERIVRLERQNRWMKCAAVVAVGLFLTLGQSKPPDTIKAKHIEAQSFTLLGRDGKVWGGWVVSKRGPIFYLANEGSEPHSALFDDPLGLAHIRILLQVRTDDSLFKGSHIKLIWGEAPFTIDHTRTITLEVGPGDAMLALASGLSKRVVVNFPGKAPMIRFYDDQHKEVFRAP